MSFSANTITFSGGVAMIAGNDARTYISIQNTGSNTFYLGVNGSVTVNDGFPLAEDDTITSMNYLGSYFVVQTGSTIKSTVSFIEEDF